MLGNGINRDIGNRFYSVKLEIKPPAFLGRAISVVRMKGKKYIKFLFLHLHAYLSKNSLPLEGAHSGNQDIYCLQNHKYVIQRMPLGLIAQV